MVNFKKNSQIVILLILIIIFSINTNFFRNLYEIALYKFDNRIAQKYDYCAGESIGYLLYIKKKYQINDNPKIVNYIHTPSVDWSIINTRKVNKNSNKLIFLNYPGSNFTKELNKINNNLFELKDAYFFQNRFSKIENIKIIDSSNNLISFNSKISIYTIDKSRNRRNIKNLNMQDNLDINLKKLDLNEKKLYFKVNDNRTNNLENIKIKVSFKNKYNLDDFKIINNTDKCYYVEQI